MIKSLKAFALHLPSLTVGLAFFSLSLLFGSWLARIPEVQAALLLSEGQLGIALLGLPAGALAIMPFAGWLTNRLSTGAAAGISTVLFCLAAPLPALAGSFAGLIGTLFVVGLTNSFMNISINAAAAALERHHQISIMSSCHGMFSLGAMVGAGSSGLIASAGISLHLHLVGVALLLIILQIILRPVTIHLPEGNKSESNGLAVPPPALWGLAFIGFCIMIGEGAIADWSAIYLRKIQGAGPFTASLGYAGFAMAMAIGRFGGDTIRLHLGAKKAILTGSLLGCTGMIMAIASPAASLSILGFTIVGLGFSTVVPLLFSIAANTEGISAGTGIAAVASSGVVGFLIAPPIIGFISELMGLSAGLGIVAFLALLAALVSKNIKVK
jgi:MFS family permease